MAIVLDGTANTVTPLNGALGATTPSTVVATTVVASSTIKAASTIAVGNATPSASGAGITFPATQSASTDANTLDDYEEGTWTPTVVANSGTATTFSDLVGDYTKIENLVYVRGSIRPTNGTFGASSTCIIGGLPFSGTTSAPRGGTISGVNSSNYTTNQTAIGGAEGTQIPFAMNVAITSTNLFSFSGCYIV
jgi:hypothetical protein